MTGTAPLRRWFEAEQSEFVALTRSLSDDQWAAPSLCDEWNMRDLVVHVAWHIHLPKYSVREGVRYLRYGGMDGLYARILDENHTRTHAELVAWLASRGRPNPANLVELIIHQQDIRRPLAIPRPVPTDQLGWLLSFAMTPAGGKETGGRPHERAAGLRLVATDIAWSTGEGPEVRGPGESILMTICGRAGAVDDLTGPGVDALAASISSPRTAD